MPQNDDHPFLRTENILYSDWFGSGSSHDDYKEAVGDGTAPDEALVDGNMLLLLWPDRAECIGYDGSEYTHHFSFARHRISATPLPAREVTEAAEGQWQPIETVPTDGTEVLLAILGAGQNRHWVHIGWYEPHDPFPWRFIDTFDLTPTGCCDREDDDRTPVNGAKTESVTHWMPLPAPPAALGQESE